jgi:FkbM family methyltransferase
VFDIGANLGSKADGFLAGGARVVCVEPQPECIKVLREKHQGNSKVTVLGVGLADKPGQMELSICSEAPTISTFSESWKQGRFANFKWDKTMSVEVTTLDQLIATHGVPRYCKIDVGGFELAVLKGLSQPVPYLSFEFTIELLSDARACLEYLQGLGYHEFNLKLGEAPDMALPAWVGPNQLLAHIQSLTDPVLWGGVYARRGALALQPGADVLAQFQAARLWQPGQPLRLHLGCGEQYFDGYLNVDFPPSSHTVMKVRPDAYANLVTLDFPEGRVDEVRLHHVFEHFNRVTALAQLIKWHRWLKVGGLLWLETPDLLGSARTMLSESSFKTKMGVARHLAGDQAAAWAYHLDHWFPERFEQTLSALGFGALRIEASSWPHEPYLSNVSVCATKQRNIPLPELLQNADRLLWQSTVADSEKPTYQVWTQQLRSVLAGTLAEAPVNAALPDAAAIQAGFAWLRRSASTQPLAELHDFNQRNRDSWVRAKAAAVVPGAKVLDVGAGTCPYRSMFAHCEYKTHDFKHYEGEKLGNTREYGQIDYESEITAIPLPDSSFDVILCTEVLEHVPEPVAALREMARLLRPSGRMLLTAPLGSGLHQLPFHFYGGYTPEWYRHFAGKLGLEVREITPNGGFFRQLAQECARVSWTLPQHQHLHGNNQQFIRDLFGEWLPRYLFALEEKHFIGQFTVGYHVELLKPPAPSAPGNLPL